MNSPVLIVGLGNPGKEYQHTRHNVGFDVLELYAKLRGLSFGRAGRGAQTAEGEVRGHAIALLKPMTFMNQSGEPLARRLRQSNVPAGAVLVVVDDIHLPIGRLRLRSGGSDGGHNGLKSITAHMHTQDYPRLRIGVGEPNRRDEQIDHVLSRFSREESEIIATAIQSATDAIDCWIDDGIEAAMNRFNGS